jgi:predicted component of type VI protein secretion system
MPTLMIQLPGLPPVSHVVNGEMVTIGRMKGNTIVIDDASISLMHAKITRKDGQYFLKDLNSTNGTIVNGQPIAEVRLRDQDRVRFADITTQFVSDPAPVTALPASLPMAAAPSTAAPAPTRAAQPLPPPPQNIVPLKPVSAPASKAKAKMPVRALAIAASIAVVAIGGGALITWNHITAKAKASEVAFLPQTPAPSRGPDSSIQITPGKPDIEARVNPVSEETAPASALNIGELTSALKSNDSVERRRAASALHGAGPDAKQAIPALREALKDSDHEVQMWAALALVNTQTYDRAVIPILVRSLQNENTVLRQVACLSLGLIPYQAGDKDTVIPALTEAAKDSDEDVRKAAKSALNIVAADTSQSAAK